tara:strand:- start:1441 stop:1968 length:528 start_codon:yes stop_codon:yes gene_type:complete
MIKYDIRDSEEVKNLCDLATQICGIRKGSLAYKSRKEQYTIPRSVVAVIARKELKIHHDAIAKELNRDRCSIYHYEGKHEANYISYPKYREVFNSVYNAYSDIKKNKKIIKDPTEMINHLIHSGVRHSRRPTMQINIETNKFKIRIDTDFKDFSNNMDICHEVLKDYECKIYVKS